MPRRRRASSFSTFGRRAISGISSTRGKADRSPANGSLSSSPSVPIGLCALLAGGAQAPADARRGAGRSSPRRNSRGRRWGTPASCGRLEGERRDVAQHDLGAGVAKPAPFGIDPVRQLAHEGCPGRRGRRLVDHEGVPLRPDPRRTPGCEIRSGPAIARRYSASGAEVTTVIGTRGASPARAQHLADPRRMPVAVTRNVRDEH